MEPVRQTKPIEEEGRYGFGTTPAIDAFFKSITTKKQSKEIILAINISTLLRNSLSAFTFIDGKKVENQATKGLDVAGVVRKVQSYTVEIANEFSTICSAQYKDYASHILFYLVDYTKQVPKEWQKISKSENVWRLATAEQAFMRVMPPCDQTSGNVTMHVRMTSQMKVPSFKGIAEVLKSFAKYDVDVHLVSHMPLDYHLSSYSGRKGYLYRSHTGEVVKLLPSELGKVVFREEAIPFYTTTHVLLGDKYLIKGCLSGKDRSTFIDLAKTNRWNLRTDDYISMKIRDYNWNLPYKLN